MERKKSSQIFFFLIVGLLGFFIEVTIIKIGLYLSFGPLASRFISLPIAIFFTFWMNRFFSFAVKSKPELAEFGKYFMCMIVGACLNFGIYSSLIQDGFEPVISLMVAVVCAASFNFAASRVIFLGRKR